MVSKVMGLCYNPFIDIWRGKYNPKLLFSVILALFIASFGFWTVYASGLGGYISEKLLERSGVTNSHILIDMSGVSNSSLDTGMSGRVTVSAASNIYMDGTGSHATLSGNLQDMNGFPSVTVYFEWGYDASYGHTTTSQVMATTGSFSATLDHFDPSETVYFRGVAVADGKNYSSPSSFVASGASFAWFNLLDAVVTLAYVALVIFVVIQLGQRSTIVALLFMAIAIYVGEAFITVIAEALRNIF